MPASFMADISTKYSGRGMKGLTVSHYHDNRAPALTISSLRGEPLLTASVNVARAPKPGNIIIKDWSENEGIEKALHDAGLIRSEDPIPHVAGFCVALEWEMRGQLKEAWEAHCKEMGWTD